MSLHKQNLLYFLRNLEMLKNRLSKMTLKELFPSPELRGNRYAVEDNNSSLREEVKNHLCVKIRGMNTAVDKATKSVRDWWWGCWWIYGRTSQQSPVVCLQRSSETRLILEVFYDCVREFPTGTAENLPMSGRLGEEMEVNTHLHTLRINLGLCCWTLLTDVCIITGWCDGLFLSFH